MTDPPGDPPEEHPHQLDDDALLAECRVETFRAGGPGGQHQNKAETAVRLTHLPTKVTATARESRSQHRNRKTALARLRAALELAKPETPRIPTKTPPRAERKRLEEKRRRSETKRHRRPPEPDH